MIQFKKAFPTGSFGNNFTEVNLDTGGNTLCQETMEQQVIRTSRLCNICLVW